MSSHNLRATQIGEGDETQSWRTFPRYWLIDETKAKSPHQCGVTAEGADGTLTWT